MRKFPLTLKVTYLLLVVSLVMVNCGDTVIEVWVTNQSQDNININNSRHLGIGESTPLNWLNDEMERKSFFTIWRTKGGCLATIYYEGVLWPDPEKGENSFKDEIIITEPGERNTFSAEALLDIVTVSVGPCS